MTTQARRVNERELLTSYHTKLVERGVTGYRFAACWAQYVDVMQFRRLYPSGERAKGLPERLWRETLNKAVAIYEDFG